MTLKDKFKHIFKNGEKLNSFINILRDTEDPSIIVKFNELMTLFYMVHGEELSEQFNKIDEINEKLRRLQESEYRRIKDEDYRKFRKEREAMEKLWDEKMKKLISCSHWPNNYRNIK